MSWPGLPGTRHGPGCSPLGGTGPSLCVNQVCISGTSRSPGPAQAVPRRPTCQGAPATRGLWGQGLVVTHTCLVWFSDSCTLCASFSSGLSRINPPRRWSPKTPCNQACSFGQWSSHWGPRWGVSRLLGPAASRSAGLRQGPRAALLESSRVMLLLQVRGSNLQSPCRRGSWPSLRLQGQARCHQDNPICWPGVARERSRARLECGALRTGWCPLRRLLRALPRASGNNSPASSGCRGQLSGQARPVFPGGR